LIGDYTAFDIQVKSIALARQSEPSLTHKQDPATGVLCKDYSAGSRDLSNRLAPRPRHTQRNAPESGARRHHQPLPTATDSHLPLQWGSIRLYCI